MTLEAKPFQRATIEAVVQAFAGGGGSNRFLVADEVGLGKTVVARGVVEKMSGRGRPLRVFYVCSNLAIGAQNLKRLVSFLPDEETEQATAKVDRPSLMPTRPVPSHGRVNVYSLTPGTALPSRRGPGAEGRVEERAFGVALLDLLVGRRIRGLGPAMRGRRAGHRRFYGDVRYYSRAIRHRGTIERGFAGLFQRALRAELGLAPGQRLPARIEGLVERGERGELIRAVRGALAVAALDRVRPDLVIFDEFQRFRDFLTETAEGPEPRLDAAGLRVLRAIRGEAADRHTPLLLLSATPYTPFKGRGEDGVYGDSAGDFFEVVNFLNGGGAVGLDAAERARRLFATVEEELRKGAPFSTRAEQARSELTMRLRPVLSRTERPSSGGDARDDSGGGDREVCLLPADVSVFRHLKKSLRCEDYGWAVGLWQSVPLPMQTLGRGYKAWRGAATVPAGRGVSLTGDMRKRFARGGPWAHPGLRALLEVMPAQRLALPWVAPSLEWWRLGGGWSARRGAAIDGKLLVFSRFRAVPLGVSGLLSYTVEASLRGRLKGKHAAAYDSITRRRFLVAAPRRPSLLGLFHPSPLLAGVDPTARGLGSLRTARSTVRAQLRELLAAQGIQIVALTPRARRPAWELLAAIEHGANRWAASSAAWHGVAAGLGAGPGAEAGGRLSAIVRRWDEKASDPVTEIGESEFRALCDLALDAPGVVLGRALKRHWREALEPGNIGTVAGLCWRGLRSYLDKPWFAAALGGRERSYADRIRRAVVEGNLESVLDEHFWYLGAAAGMEWGEAVAELEASLRLRPGSVLLHEGGPGSDTLRLRCHAAVPLNEARTASRARGSSPGADVQESPLRPDEVRRAFNAPFWPHVVATTSVGQEGLDFHPWCRSLAHWDLCSGPVALEQREGRVSRFAGLSVRRAIARRLSPPKDRSADDSPWNGLASRAEEELADSSGLAPWWVAPGSSTHRVVFTVPGSEKPARLARLQRERALYRLVLGMPDQADLLDLIAAEEAWDPERVRRACLDLSAWGATTC